MPRKFTGQDFDGPAPMPRRPTNALPGTPEKAAVLSERAARGQTLFHPADPRLPVEGRLAILAETSGGIPVRAVAIIQAPPEPPNPARDETLVSLYEVAPLVGRTVGWLYERYYRGDMPASVEDRPPLWAWCELRPWLEAQFKVQLPIDWTAHIARQLSA